MTRDSEHDCADTQSKRTLSRPIATVFTFFGAFIGLNARAVRRTLPKGPYSGMLGASFGKIHHDFLKEELVFLPDPV